MRVHLIAFNPTPQTTLVKNRPFVLPGLIEDTPIFRVQLEFHDEFRSVTALDSSTEVMTHEGRVQVTVEDIHEVIQCRY